MRSALLLLSVLAFLLIVTLVTSRLFEHFSEQKDEMIKSLPNPPTERKSDGVPIRIDAAGSVFLDKMQVTESQLAALLAKLAMSQGDRRVVLNPDENASQRAISEVLNACAKAGISNVSLTSRPSDDAP